MLLTDTKKRATQTYNEKYDEAVQHGLLNMLLSDREAFAICRSILREEYFDARLRPAVRFILDYAEQYKILPAVEIVNDNTKVKVEKFSEGSLHSAYLMQSVEEFCQYKAMELTVLDSIDLLQTGRASEIVERAKKALMIGLHSSLGTDYFDDPETRLRRMLEHTAKIPTGWSALDQKLYGGVARGELNVFAGGSGSGKSLFLQNLAINWSLDGYIVCYISLELSEDEVTLRLDAMITGRGTRDIVKDIDGSVILIRNQQRIHKPGKLFVRRLPESGTTANTVHAYLKEFQIKTGLKPDAVIIDYLDLLHPTDRRVDPSNLFLKDKYISEELRSLLHETNTFGATASQLNRSAVSANDYDHSHIAGGLSKVMTADNVLGIYSTHAMKEKGVCKLEFLKARSSASLGHYVELAYNPTSMRITDAIGPLDDVDKPFSKTELRASLKSSDAVVVTPSPTDWMEKVRIKHGVVDPP